MVRFYDIDLFIFAWERVVFASCQRVGCYALYNVVAAIWLLWT